MVIYNYNANNKRINFWISLLKKKNNIQKWIEKFLEKKAMTSRILFLGTEFEASRIKEQRLDRIFAEMNYVENKKEENFLDPKLIENPDDDKQKQEQVFTDESK